MINRLSVLIVGLVFIAIWQHPALRVTTITMTPAAYLSDSEGLTILEPLRHKPMLSAWVQTTLTPRWRNEFKSADEVMFRYHFPDHIEVTIVEKAPRFLFISEYTNKLVTDDGVVLNPTRQDVDLPDPDQVMIIHGMPSQALGVETLSESYLDQIQRVKANLDRYPKLGQIQFELKVANQYILYMQDTLPIKLGTLTDIDEKFYNLSTFLSYYEPLQSKKTINYIDLRVPDRVVVGYDT